MTVSTRPRAVSGLCRKRESVRDEVGIDKAVVGRTEGSIMGEEHLDGHLLAIAAVSISTYHDSG